MAPRAHRWATLRGRENATNAEEAVKRSLGSTPTKICTQQLETVHSVNSRPLTACAGPGLIRAGPKLECPSHNSRSVGSWPRG
jgi:hypothetical protein